MDQTGNQHSTRFLHADSSSPSKLLSPPAVNLPKGGGAISGIGERFSVHTSKGTGSLHVPLNLSQGRGGFYPTLSVHYDSGAGNGPFGLGWKLAIPAISRKTERGIPRYQDAIASDTFVLSGSEDLVPALIQQDGQWIQKQRSVTVTETQKYPALGGYSIQAYRPRVEGGFARIERWVHESTDDVHWRVTTPENITHVYGKNGNSRVVNPSATSQIFQWLLSESYDDKGNIIVYEYKLEDQENVGNHQSFEMHRLGAGQDARRYLKRIFYGNQTPFVRGQWHFQAVFDYGEHDVKTPTPKETQGWGVRRDAFSYYRAGFELRTRRLCRRVLMFHDFAELASEPVLVRSTDFTYDENPVATYLTSVEQKGYIQDKTTSSYNSKSYPPLEFGYSKAKFNHTVRSVQQESL